MSAASLPPLIASLYVASGAAVGGLARYHIGRGINYTFVQGSTFPWATLVINVVGSLLMGVLLGWLARSSGAPQFKESMQLLIGVGLLGGFTTFSAFSAEMVTMIYRGQMLASVLYGSASVIAGMIAFVIALIAVQGLQ
ncbi:fluoride efflux transporter CrcB [Erythrobacter aurantius]|uniref:fluoride efflux transporter CrcB n=1 Tax=Erythrobacter aurantius TaxID=2909249 RepID=UPI00207AFD92|nr:fluoride efflux transporter CrcB [Erythrobacter aurantius]